jgi:hypothetical protein
MAKTLAEAYGFKKSAKKIDAKNLRKMILREYRSILIEQEEAEASGPLNGEYKGDAVSKSTNVRDVDPVEMANQLLSGDDDAPLVASTQGEWFATTGAQAKEWIEKIGPEVFVTRLKDLAKKVPTTGLPKSVMPFLPGPGDAQGDFSQVEDALTPGGEYNVDTHDEGGTAKGDDEKDGDVKEAIFRAAEYLISEKTAPPKPNTFTSMDAAAEEFMTGGLEKQDGVEGDDAIKITKGGSLAAADAIPTQSNILIYKGLGMAMNPKNQIAGGDLDAWAGTNGEILDGHHRWAATMFNDPGASMGLAGQVDLQGLGSGNEQEVLKYLTAIGNALGNATKTESRRRRGSRDEVIMERWNKLAGLLKD